jgi:putative Ca2+/H+ antiporter (TMEM165/GDT1 family)
VSLSVAATVFGVILVAELPDKTMIATLIMGSRARPLWVWLGASGAFLVHTGAAVGAGRLLELLPHRVLDAVVSALFLAGAAYLLFVPERREQEKGDHDAQRELTGRPRRVVATAFVVILIGEIGDLTQLLIVNLVARFHQPLAVFTGAFAALVAAAAAGAFGGRVLLRFVTVGAIRKTGGVVLLGFAAYSIYALVR